MQERQRNPWKTLGLVIAIGIPTLLVAGAFVGMLEDDRQAEEIASVVIADSAPPAWAVEECNHYAAQANRAEEGAKPEAAAGDASADVAANAPGVGPKRATQGVSGTIVGMNEQNSRSAEARAAFRDCMSRKGYAS